MKIEKREEEEEDVDGTSWVGKAEMSGSGRRERKWASFQRERKGRNKMPLSTAKPETYLLSRDSGSHSYLFLTHSPHIRPHSLKVPPTTR